MNQSRKFCALWFESHMVDWDWGVFGEPGWSEADLRRWLVARRRGDCGLVHGTACDVHPAYWEQLRGEEDLRRI